MNPGLLNLGAVVQISKLPARLDCSRRTMPGSVNCSTRQASSMPRILMTTFGSYGDLNPYLAMARVLIGEGDQVTIATHAEYREQVERVGVRFVPVKPGLDELGPQESWAAKANSSFRGAEFIVRTLIIPYLEESYRTIKAAAEGHDLIISHILSFASPLVAEELGIPWVSSILQPASFFSAHDPSAIGFMTFLPRMKFLGPRFMSVFLRLLARPTESWTAPVRELRARLGLPPFRQNLLTRGFSPLGTLALFPSSFAPSQPDWPANVKQTGFPLFDEETTSEISAPLQMFLDSGPAPVVFTLGTAVIKMETAYFEIAYQSIKKLGLRAVFLVGKNPRRVPPAAMTDAQIHISDYEPFSGLFPHAAAIVHQCGIGTTAQALTAGRPQVLVPFAHDQPDNARRVAELGIGISVPARRLSAARLHDSLRTTTTNHSFGEKASQFAEGLKVDQFGQQLREAVSGFLRLREGGTPLEVR